MFKVPGTSAIFEDTHRVAQFRRILEPSEGRKHRLLQFYAEAGGLRTVSVGDIADIK